MYVIFPPRRDDLAESVLNMEHPKYKLHRELKAAYVKAYPFKNQAQVEENVSIIWKDIRNKTDYENLTHKKIDELKVIASKKKLSNSSVWSKFSAAAGKSKKAKPDTPPPKILAAETPIEVCSSDSTTTVDSSTLVSSSSASATSILIAEDKRKIRATPKQDELKSSLQLETDILLGLHRKREKGLLSSRDSKELSERESRE